MVRRLGAQANARSVCRDPRHSSSRGQDRGRDWRISACRAMGVRRGGSERSMTLAANAASRHRVAVADCAASSDAGRALRRPVVQSFSSGPIVSKPTQRRAGSAGFPLPPRSEATCPTSRPNPAGAIARSRPRTPAIDAPRRSLPIRRQPAEGRGLGHAIGRSVSRATHAGSARPASPIRPATAPAVARSTPLWRSPPRRG